MTDLAGVTPPPSCLSAFIRHPNHLSFPKLVVGNPPPLSFLKFRRESTPPVIPEIFNRESMFLNNLDPGLKIAGVTRRWASTSFQYRRPRLKDCRGDEGVGIQGSLLRGRKLPSVVFTFSAFHGFIKGYASLYFG